MKIVEYMIEEDIGFGDITTDALIPKDKVIEGEIISKDEGILAGIEIAEYIFSSRDISFEILKNDGDEIKNKDIICKFKGSARKILKVERTLLNLMMRMSGISTTTNCIVNKIKSVNPNIRIAGTRKTFPSVAKFDKRAIAIGGGDTHRFRLDDLVLIKDNHISAVGSLKKAIQIAKMNNSFSKKIEVEVETAEDLIFAINEGVDIVMLDNFTPSEINHAISRLNDLILRKNVILEVSGGINPDNILDYALLDVDVISLGYLTHSVKSLDFSLNLHFD